MTRKFGVEIEFLVPSNVSFDTVAQKLTQAGIETLYAGYTHSVYNKWKVVPDQSVSYAGMTGIELVSPPLMYGEEAAEQIRTACRVLADLRATVKRCCGLHVHIDASGLSIKQIKNIVERYSKYEDEIDSWMPQSRRGLNTNSYCKSVKGYNKNANDVERIVSDRYHKINTHSYVRYGTLEFRHHSGTTNAEKINNWISFLMQFVEKSTKIVTSQATPEVASPNGNFFKASLTPSQAWQVLGVSTTRQFNNILKMLNAIKDVTSRHSDSYRYHCYNVSLANLTGLNSSTITNLLRQVGKVIDEARENYAAYTMQHPNIEVFVSGYLGLSSISHSVLLQLIDAFEYWRDGYHASARQRSLLRNVAPQRLAQPMVPAFEHDNGVFDGIAGNLITYYNERAMDLGS